MVEFVSEDKWVWVVKKDSDSGHKNGEKHD